MTAPGFGVCVDGEEVDIKRFWCFDAASVLEEDDVPIDVGDDDAGGGCVG